MKSLRPVVLGTALCFFLASCASTPRDHTDQEPPPDQQDSKVNPYPLNHVACREENLDHVQRVVDAATTASSKGAILYFHGGLSAQKYMKESLGPWLVESIFATAEMDGFYPIFVNYDAELYMWENFVDIAREILKSDAFESVKDEFDNLVSRKRGVSFRQLSDDELRDFGRQYLDGQSFTSFRNDRYRDGTEPEEYYLAILEDDALAREVGLQLTEDPDFIPLSTKIDEAAASSLEQHGRVKSAGIFKAAKVIARILARFAIQNNHQIVPTIEEEFFRELGYAGVTAQKLAAIHWSNVKEHARECFASGSGGDTLLTALLAHQDSNHGFQIYAISHSAGSIPVGRMLESLDGRGKALNGAHLVAPAINQSDFAKLVLRNEDAIADAGLRIYPLNLEQEEDDDVWKVYPASLLYLVSGMAEDRWYSDRMLLIEQHLTPDRFPYDKGWYRRLVREKQARDVWQYFQDNPSARRYYPAAFDGAGDRPVGASHECTKYPWVSTQIANEIVRSITGNNPEQIPVPTHDSKKVDELTRKCEKVQ